jgi:branched-subunit amino acid aminotransferase/4-amino-4-deoxychorismate lyase
MHFKIPHAANEVFLLDYKSGATASRDLNETMTLSNAGILEGLTSNVFAVHQDGTLYTAPDHTVLGGYARQLVMESAIRIGMNVNFLQPICLADATLWTEVFVTSAIKLVTPVESIIIPQHDNNAQSSSNAILWSQPASTTNQRVWKTIYSDILSHNF